MPVSLTPMRKITTGELIHNKITKSAGKDSVDNRLLAPEAGFNMSISPNLLKSPVGKIRMYIL